MGGEKNGNGGGAECQGYGPLALGSPGLGPDPGGVVSWEERQRKEEETDAGQGTGLTAAL